MAASVDGYDPRSRISESVANGGIFTLKDQQRTSRFELRKARVVCIEYVA
jgi:hypothetical protein